MFDGAREMILQWVKYVHSTSEIAGLGRKMAYVVCRSIINGSVMR